MLNMPGCRGGSSKLEINAKSNDVRTIIARYYSAWSAGQKLRVDVLRAASAIINCRTEHLGWHLESCDCGHGGIDSNGQFVKSERSVLVPARVLHAVIRGKLCDVLKKAVVSGDLVIPTLMTAAKCHSLLNRMGRVRWNVRLQERYPHGVSVAGYLARYMAGGPIVDKRICSVTNSAVVFKYRDHRDGVEKRMTVTPQEFLSRWFEHVPPRGLRMIRRSGLYANCCRVVRQAICAQLESRTPAASAAEPRAAAARVCALDPERCPRCNTCVTVRTVYRPPVLFAVSLVVERKSGLAQPP